MMTINKVKSSLNTSFSLKTKHSGDYANVKYRS